MKVNLKSAIRNAAVAVGVGMVGCTSSTVPIDHAVVAYDITTAESVEKQLLLNIARARNNQPIHFTAGSSITATYRLTPKAGSGPALTWDSGGLVGPLPVRTARGRRP